MKNKIKIKNIVAFCVLMQNGDGIESKSPAYIMEKFERYCLFDRDDEFIWGLDSFNFAKLRKWVEKWLKSGLTYEIVENDKGQKGIKCLYCGLTSWNENDIKNLYCENCHKFHECPPHQR